MIDPDYIDPDEDGEPEPDDVIQSPPDWASHMPYNVPSASLGITATLTLPQRRG